MGKIYKHSLRRDVAQDHVHALPDGRMTEGVLYKPNANQRAGWHSHLYEHDGMVYESDARYEDGDHVHHVHEFGGMTSAPLTGVPTAYPKHKGEEMGRMDAAEEEVRAVIGDVDEGRWNKAKQASERTLGVQKWPFIVWWYQQHGNN